MTDITPLPQRTIMDVVLKKTCSACPEQYDAYLDGKKVGYFRLRGGYFRVDAEECGGPTVYEATHEQGLLGDGMFEPQEREKFLTEGVMALLKHLDKQPIKPKQDMPTLDQLAKKKAQDQSAEALKSLLGPMKKALATILSVKGQYVRLQHLHDTLDILIEATPTGGERDFYTEFNILVVSLMEPGAEILSAKVARGRGGSDA